MPLVANDSYPPLKTNALEESVLSPLVQAALTLYKYSYKLIPSLLVDVEILPSFIKLKLRKPNWLELECLWITTIFLGLVAFLFCSSFVLLHKLLNPLAIQLDLLTIIFLICLLICAAFVVEVALTVYKTWADVTYINRLLANGLRLRKTQTLLTNCVYDLFKS